MSTKIFFVGATGYLGGSILSRLLEHPKWDSFDVRILLRTPSKAKDFESFGLKSVIGSLTDYDLLEQESSKVDIVFQSADADGLLATNAILKGLKRRFDNTQTPPSLIHTSGTGVFINNALGKYASDTIYSDLNVPQIEGLDIAQPHRVVDVAITDAGNQGYVKTHIVLPSTVWGVASTRFTDKGLQRPISQQIPSLIKLGVDRGKPAIVGDGVNIWPHVQIEETAEFYYIFFDAVISGKNPANGREGYYFLENGEYTHKQIAQAVATSLFKRGIVDTDTPVPLTETELNGNLPAMILGTNSRCRGERSRSIGWNPVKTTAELIESIEPEVEAWIKNN